MASVISDLLRETPLTDAVDRARETLNEYPGSERIQGLVDRALDLAESNPGDSTALMSLGGAWAGDEALALSVYAALSFPDDLEAAMIFAVNHTGDSDSTGAIVGNLLGAIHGPNAIPARWTDEVELREVVETMAADSVAHFVADSDPQDIDRYPAW
jgi:ADP-ribosylglycohydrolase